jgi:peptidoglycan/LPS O-acetylase OafA/YrhL
MAALDWPHILPRTSSFFSLSLLANGYPALHGIRVLAIFAVVQVHATKALTALDMVEKSGATRFSQKVFFGMDLFFILSGFLIGTMLLQSLSQGNGRFALARFYARRAFRTFPLYYFMILILVLLGGPRNILVSELFYLTNYVPGGPKQAVMNWGWSLCVEEHFYLVAPLLLIALGAVRWPASRLALLLVLWLLGLWLRLDVYLSHIGPWSPGEMFAAMYIKTHTRFDILIAGVAVAYLQFEYGAQLKRLLARPAMAAAFAGLSLLALLFLLLPLGWLFDRGLYKVLCWGTVTSIMYVPLLLLLLNRGGPVVRFLGSPWFLRIATLGYGVYLVHIPVFFLVAPLLAGLGLTGAAAVFWMLLVGMLGSFVMAYLLHILVEKPALLLRDILVPSRSH